jgi:dihydroorotase-like cyclic amidohydrolase
MSAISMLQARDFQMTGNASAHSLHPSKETQAQAPETWFGMAGVEHVSKTKSA